MTIFSVFRRLVSECYLLCNRWQFGSLGKKCFIYLPLEIRGKKNIYIGNDVSIGDKTWLATLVIDNEETARLEIGNGVVIGHMNHIYATGRVLIEDKVLTADRVYISDNLHEYRDIRLPVVDQPIRQISHVRIGTGSWLGEGVCVIGAKIGKGCVIGANAVVTKDIPDYSVAVGIPARVIKKYNFDTEQWEKIVIS